MTDRWAPDPMMMRRAQPAGQSPGVGGAADALAHGAEGVEPALQLAAVSHRYGAITALDQVSLSVGMGEIVCLVGPSGCGKSTLLRLIAGLEDIQHGQVKIAGCEVAVPGAVLPPEQRGVGIVFQDFALFPHMSAIDNVAFGLFRLPTTQRQHQAEEWLGRVGLSGARNQYPHTLSGGQQQRIALARALAPRPSVVLLDEPFSGLDSRLREVVRSTTLKVLRASRAAALIVTHDPEEAMFVADRIILMRDGKLVQEGTPASLWLEPVDAYAASFFGEINRLTGVAQHGFVDTVFGPLACDLADGTLANILIRPGGILVAESAKTVPSAEPVVTARVASVRFLGRDSLLHLNLGGSGMHELLQARVPGMFLPPGGASLHVTLDHRQVFVFAAGGTI